MSSIGGQAVIEGVMMRNKNKLAIAVRQDKKIIIKKEKLTSLSDKIKLFKLPFFRGMLALIETMVVGIKALNYSANVSIGKEEEKLSSWMLVVTLIFAFGIGFVLFKLLPLAIAQLLSVSLALKENSILFNLIDAVFKGSLFIGYILIISRMDDVKRLFQYHGAEHKTIHCYEAKKELTVKNVKKYTPLHARCGTSFLIFVIIISIIVYTFLPSVTFWVNLLYRFLLLPVIAGIAYEIIKLSGKYENNKILNIAVKPGLWVQKITTSEPDNKMIEVAIKSLKAVI
jgi:uncharacterized protein YqhQ